MSAILECDDVSKIYGGLKAVSSVSFEVAKGQIFAIIGPNGAGKTTLFEVISGLSRATSGSIRLNGEDIHNASPGRICRRGVLRLFQTPVVFETQTTLTNVLVGAMYGRTAKHRLTMRFNDEAIEAGLQALQICGLLDKQRVRADLLSVFEKKRLMLATALATDCQVLLLDEPVGGLNLAERQEFLALLRSLNQRGLTVLMIEHVMQAVRELADVVMVLHHGEKILDGPPAVVMENERILEVYLGTTASRSNAALREARNA